MTDKYKPILELWYEFVLKRVEDVGQEFAETEAAVNILNRIQGQSKNFLEVLSAKDKRLFEVLEEEEAEYKAFLERHFYIAGYKDGMKLSKTLLLEENEDRIIL